MIPNEYRPLVSKIIEKTGQNAMKWETTSDEYKFLCRIGLNSVVVQRFNAYPEDEPCISFNVRNVHGESVDFFSTMIDEADYDIMEQLFNAARRRALNIDRIIADMMSRLG